jgi:hypothetical protein
VLHTVPILLGGGTRLFDGTAIEGPLEIVESLEGPLATHVRYQVR